MSYSPRTILVGAAVSVALTTLARAADTDSLGIGYVASPVNEWSPAATALLLLPAAHLTTESCC